VGCNNAQSKTEAMFCNPPSPSPEPDMKMQTPVQFTSTLERISAKSLSSRLSSCFAALWQKMNQKLAENKSAHGAFIAICKRFFSAKSIENFHKNTAHEGLILIIV
jgi:hypothetical protein